MALMVGSLMAVTSCKEDPNEASDNPQVSNVEPAEGPTGTLITVTGSGLAQMESVIFGIDSVEASFNPAFNNDGAILFRIPDEAVRGEQEIYLTNAKGNTVTINLEVFGVAVVSSASNYIFSAGDVLTLEGLNMDDVTAVSLAATGDEATIMSQTATSLEIEMPPTTAERSRLSITNQGGTSTTSIEFIHRDSAFVVYGDNYGVGPFGGNVQSWSWGVSVDPLATAEVRNGEKSLKVDYNNGGLSLLLDFDWSGPRNYSEGVDELPTYLVFWVKPMDESPILTIRADNDGGNGSTIDFDDMPLDITPPAGEWTYYKIELTKFIGGEMKFARLNFTNAGAQTVYFDDILLVD